VVAAFDRAGSSAITDARDEEKSGDDEQQAVHKWRSANDAAGLRVAQRGTGWDRAQQHDREEADGAEQREPQTTRLGCFVNLLRLDNRVLRRRSVGGGGV